MKTIVRYILVVCIIGSCFSCLCGCSKAGENGELKIFNWGEYLSDGTDGSIDVIAQFEKETGIKVSAYDTYDSNEQMYAKLKSGSSDYDLVFPSDYMISRLIQENLVQKIDVSQMQNYSQVMEQYKGSARGYDPTDEYSVPYTWGHVGIVYNQPMVEQLSGQKAEDVITGWDAFWNPAFSDQMYMFINSRDSFGIAEKLLGYSLNTTDPAQIAQACSKLKEQKPLVQAYVMDEMFDKMENDEAALSPAYAGDIITMMDSNPDLRYCFPKEGTNLFVDGVCITSTAKHQENALKFIDFLCRPEIAHANASYIRYSTPIQGALSMLDEELKNNPIAYPSSHAQALRNLPQPSGRNTNPAGKFMDGNS